MNVLTRIRLQVLGPQSRVQVVTDAGWGGGHLLQILHYFWEHDQDVNPAFTIRNYCSQSRSKSTAIAKSHLHPNIFHSLNMLLNTPVMAHQSVQYVIQANFLPNDVKMHQMNPLNSRTIGTYVRSTLAFIKFKSRLRERNAHPPSPLLSAINNSCGSRLRGNMRLRQQRMVSVRFRLQIRRSSVLSHNSLTRTPPVCRITTYTSGGSRIYPYAEWGVTLSTGQKIIER